MAKKKACISCDISQDALLKKGRQMGGTQNDVVMAILSLSLKQFLSKYTNDDDTDQISLAVPFSLRQPPQHAMDFKVNNEFAVLPLRLRLINNFREGFQLLHDDMNSVKGSMTPFAMVHMHRLIMMFPSFLTEWILNDFSKRFTFVFNSVSGPI